MSEQVKQDWTELERAVSSIRSFLLELPPPLRLGTVVKTDTGSIGVVTGVDAPEEYGNSWSYAVCIPNTEDCLQTETAWYDAEQLEAVYWQKEWQAAEEDEIADKVNPDVEENHENLVD